jgi:hypothetical protein
MQTLLRSPFAPLLYAPGPPMRPPPRCPMTNPPEKAGQVAVGQEDRDFVADLRRTFLATPSALDEFMSHSPYEFRDEKMDDYWLTKLVANHRLALQPKLRQLVEAIHDEAATANTVISLGRDDEGSGRVRVATAMHRIAHFAERALAKIGGAK